MPVCVINNAKWQVRAIRFCHDANSSLHTFSDTTQQLKVAIYFAHPYHSWERGANENMNGLIRQYLPKGISFEGVTEAYVLQIQQQLNNRPRKSLGYLTPKEYAFAKFGIVVT